MNQTPSKTFRTKCHPEANGRHGVPGEYKWDFTFPLEDGSMLEIQMGREGHDDFRGFLLREEMDDAADAAEGSPQDTDEGSPQDTDEGSPR